MLDLGWSELLVVAVLTVLIFGPKELPTVLRTVTQLIGRLRGMARDFQRTMDDVAREAELDKLKSEVQDVANTPSMLGPDADGDMFDGLFDDKKQPDDKTAEADGGDKADGSYVPGFDSAETPADETATGADNGEAGAKAGESKADEADADGKAAKSAKSGDGERKVADA